MLKNLTKIFVLLLIFAISNSMFLAAQDLSTLFTAQDYYNFEWISDPQISPDGKKIIYVRNFVEIKSDKFYSNLR